MQTSIARTVASVAVLAFCACVTVNVYFPAAAVKDLSRKIEEEVQKEAARQQEAPDTPSPAEEPEVEAEPEQHPIDPGSAGLLDLLLGATPAYAQAGVPAPEVTNPAIRKIIELRGGRLAALNPYKASGVIGENNQGLLEIRNLEAQSDLKSRAEVQRLVKAENTDREALFREIAIMKKVDLSQLPKIQETYASTIREMARAGDWIQQPDGTWKQK